MHQKNVAAMYLREMAGAMLIYMVLLVATIMLARPMENGMLRTLLLLTPMIGVVLVVIAIARHLRRVDEYVRQNLFEMLALACALTAGLTFTYGFLETAGFPRLSMFVVLPLMGAVCAAVACFRALRGH